AGGFGRGLCGGKISLLCHRRGRRHWVDVKPLHHNRRSRGGCFSGGSPYSFLSPFVSCGPRCFNCDKLKRGHWIREGEAMANNLKVEELLTFQARLLTAMNAGRGLQGLVDELA